MVAGGGGAAFGDAPAGADAGDAVLGGACGATLVVDVALCFGTVDGLPLDIIHGGIRTSTFPGGRTRGGQRDIVSR